MTYTDPSGHCVFAPPIDTVVCIAILALTLTGDSDQSPPPGTNYPKNAHGGSGCDKSLSDCFGDVVYLKDFPEEQISESETLLTYIPADEFEPLLDEIAADLYFHDITWPGVASGRAAYDTPFYNGGGKGINPIYPANQQVCIGGVSIGCSDRSEINYIAQGMWDARADQPKIASEAIIYYWKWSEYGGTPSEDTLFWNEYGYDYYQKWKEEAEQAIEEWDGL